jgi:hypothetical protein
MKFRIFYAPQVQRTWEKVFILTSDGKLYCEYLMRFVSETIKKENIDYVNFKPSDFSWGKGVEGIKTEMGLAQGAITNYQDCKKELTYNEYLNLTPSHLLSGYKSDDIKKQIRWVQNYLIKLGLKPEDWDETIYNSFHL